MTRKQRLAKITEAARELEAARRHLHALVLEARTPELFGGRPISLRDIADAAGMSHEALRKMASRPIVTP